MRAIADADAESAAVFSGWLFKNSPSLNVVEHPIYDVWVKDCAMSFPARKQRCRGADLEQRRDCASPAALHTPAPRSRQAVRQPARR